VGESNEGKRIKWFEELNESLLIKLIKIIDEN